MIEEGKIGTEELDDKARRVLRLIFRTAMNPDKPFGSMNSEEHLSAARQIAGEGMVLLKNENAVLPFDLGKIETLVVVGENAVKMMTVGGGSSSLKVKKEYTPLEGIRRYVGDRAEVIYERATTTESRPVRTSPTNARRSNSSTTPSPRPARPTPSSSSAD